MRAEAETGKILQLSPGEDSPIAPEYELETELLQQNLVVGFDSASADVHPFFGLRSQLLKYVQSTGHRIFAVTSVQPGNGKTHVAVNLAAAISRIRPTVLIELDLYCPSIGQRLGLPLEQCGIEDYLSGTRSIADSGIRIAGFDLTVHRVRAPHSDPESLLASNRLAELTDAIRAADNQPICIIDTPPVVIHDDMMLIAPAIDGFIVVVQEGRTSKRSLTEGVASLSPTPIVGTVLNMSISDRWPDQEYYYYDKYNKNNK